MSTRIPSIINPTLHTAGLAGLEFVVNRALALDPATRQRLATLKDHVFLIHCTAPALGVYLIPGGDGVRLCGVYDGRANTTLTGSAAEFSKLLTAEDPASALINGAVELHGNSQALIELQKIARQLDIDWEAPLADVFGDVMGAQLGKAVRGGIGFGLQALKSFKRQCEEYLVEESALLAPTWQVRKFCSEVDQLTLRTERLEARLRKYRQQHTAATPSPKA